MQMIYPAYISFIALWTSPSCFFFLLPFDLLIYRPLKCKSKKMSATFQMHNVRLVYWKWQTLVSLQPSFIMSHIKILLDTSDLRTLLVWNVTWQRKGSCHFSRIQTPVDMITLIEYYYLLYLNSTCCFWLAAPYRESTNLYWMQTQPISN